jgi:hypothetical protein
MRPSLTYFAAHPNAFFVPHALILFLFVVLHVGAIFGF